VGSYRVRSTLVQACKTMQANKIASPVLIAVYLGV
jgi:hypothetical protein